MSAGIPLSVDVSSVRNRNTIFESVCEESCLHERRTNGGRDICFWIDHRRGIE